jgi:hypothetical protein
VPTNYIAALTKLLSVTVRLDVRKIIAEGNDAAVFFDLEESPRRGHSSSRRVASVQRRLARRVGFRWSALRGHVRQRGGDIKP